MDKYGMMDLVLLNGNIHTMENGTFSAMGVKKGCVEIVGDDLDLRGHVGADTQVIDLKGRTILPGFNDSHMHFIHYGFQRGKVCLEGLTSVGELVQAGKRHVKMHPPVGDAWVEGWGWNQNLFAEHVLPTKFDLDQISTEHPILFTRVCCHIGVVNSKAIEVLTAESKAQLPQESLQNGLIRESDLDLFYACMPKPSREIIRKAVLSAAEEAVAQGLTSIQTSDLHGLPFEDVRAVYEELASSNLLKLRVNLQLYLPKLENLKAFLAAEGESASKPAPPTNPHFKLGPLKLLLDGSLGGRTAALNESYSDDPGNLGLLTYSEETLNELVTTAHMNGMQVSLHAIGDRTMDVALNAVENAMALEKRISGSVRQDHRHRINHCQITNLKQMEKMKQLGVMADIQPIFVSSDWKMIESRVGVERARYSYAWKSLLDSGVKLAGGSDCPIEPFNPLEGIYAAVTRKDLNGFPIHGWHGDEALSVFDAIALFTSGSAYATFEEHLKGTLAVGKWADFVVLSQDPFEVKSEKIKNISVQATFVGGKLVFGGL